MNLGSLSNALRLVGAGIGAIGATVLPVANPGAGLGALVLILFLAWAFARPYQAACVLAFLTAAFPKAGIKLDGFPFPVFLFGLLFAMVLIAMKKKIVNHTALATLATVLFIFWALFRAAIFASSGIGTVAAFLAWSAIPLVMLYLATRIQDNMFSFRRSIEKGFLLAVGYAMLQFAFSIEATAIPGLTYALGDDLTQKHNVIYGGDGDYSKIPSTYQNGNIFGLVAAAFLALAIQRIIRRAGTPMDTLVLLASGAAIAVSGSRTAIVASVLAIALLFLVTGVLKTKVRVVIILGLAVSAVVAFQPQLLDRYSLANLQESGGAGRSDMWALALSNLTPLEHWFGSETFILTEGWLGVVMQIGVIGIILMCVAIAFLLKRRPGFGIAVFVLLIGVVIDSSYRFFPTWFLVAALAAASPIQSPISESAKARELLS